MVRFLIRYLGRHHLALLALFVALGGTTYAATALPKNSVGSAQLKNNAVVSAKVKNNSITGADVKESSLARVPSATTATTANAAFSIYHDGPIATGGMLVLAVPRPGNYIVTATFTAVDYALAPTVLSCNLFAGLDAGSFPTIRQAETHVESGQSSVAVLQMPFHFQGAGRTWLGCQEVGGGDARAQNVTLTAVQVGQLISNEG